MEVVKFQQSQLINADLDMYYAPSDTPALCRTSALVEELGQIEFVFTDKTGTLTRNEMEFKKCSVAGVAYADVAEENGGEEEGTRTFEELRGVLYGEAGKRVSTAMIGEREAEAAREFMTLLAVCHTVIPEVKDGKTHYQASSPDEAALVAGAEVLGYQFHVSCQFLANSFSYFFYQTAYSSLHRLANPAPSSSPSTTSPPNMKSSTSASSTRRANVCRRSCVHPAARSSFTARVQTLSLSSVLPSRRHTPRKRLSILRFVLRPSLYYQSL